MPSLSAPAADLSVDYTLAGEKVQIAPRAGDEKPILDRRKDTIESKPYCDFPHCLSCAEDGETFCRFHLRTRARMMRRQAVEKFELLMRCANAARLGEQEIPKGKYTAENLDELLLIDTDDCLIWTDKTDSHGYPVLRTDEDHFLHRAVCRIASGNPTEKQNSAAHLCGRRACVNWKHIRWSSQKENNGDLQFHRMVGHGVLARESEAVIQALEDYRGAGIRLHGLLFSSGTNGGAVC